jgi:hypothetical protein
MSNILQRYTINEKCGLLLDFPNSYSKHLIKVSFNKMVLCLHIHNILKVKS